MSITSELSNQAMAEPDVVACCTPLVAEPIDPIAATDVARRFKALGDPVRLRLLSIIASAGDGETCVCDLTEPFEVGGPTISHHLKVLRQAGLIIGRRSGTWIYYRIVPSALNELSTLLDATAALMGRSTTGAPA